MKTFYRIEEPTNSMVGQHYDTLQHQNYQLFKIRK